MVFSRIELFIGIGGRERLGCAATLRGGGELPMGRNEGTAVRLLESSSNGFYFLFPGLNSTSR
jgi:hypothetical protein